MNGEQMAIAFPPDFSIGAGETAVISHAFLNGRHVVESVEIMPATRRTDPVTSHEAEARVRPHASTGRRLVLAALALRPATDFELAEATGWQQTSIGKRRGECVALGWVEAFTAPDGTKCKRLSPSNSPAIVWAITQAGRMAHEEMKGGEE